ncbi:MAG: hypothetical protein M1546_05885 [Chloroflexi bacterium]|nr:hypothetical protein [Chloroflexota bacterium]
MATPVNRKLTTRVALRQNLERYFSVEDLQILCSDLGVEYDGLPGDGKSTRVLAIIRHLEKAGRIPELLHHCAELRPLVDWGEDLTPLEKARKPLLLGAVVASSLVLTLVVYLAFVPATMMGRFKVAVAQFGVADMQGGGQPSQDGYSLSKYIYDSLHTELDALPGNIRETYSPGIWHDSLGLFAKRANIGLVSGTTEQQRGARAKELADQIQADLLIYGNLTLATTSGGVKVGEFAPEFYVNVAEADADELTGRQRFGTPITVPLPVDLNKWQQSVPLDKVRVRQVALSRVTIGLLYDLSGKHDRALQVFQSAAAELVDWHDDEGKELLHYLIGREALYLSAWEDKANAVMQSADGVMLILALAEGHFRTALRIKPDYAAAKLGFGNTLVQQASWQASSRPSSAVDWATVTVSVTQALIEIEEAMNLNQRAGMPNSLLALKAQASLGDAHRMLGVARSRTNQANSAQMAFDHAVTILEDTLSKVKPDQTRFLAQVRLMLGVTFHEQARSLTILAEDKVAGKNAYMLAIKYYDQCMNVETLKDAVFDETLQDIRDKKCRPSRTLAQNEMAQFTQ